MNELVEILQKTEHGFKHIEKAGNELMENTELNHFELALSFLDNSVYQSRMLATYLFGRISTSDQNAFDILKNKIGQDKNWRVQEMLAKAFDYYCKILGYERALPTIKNWLNDKNPNVKRAVVEGLRIWTNRPYFKENPKIAIELISQFKNSDSEYLRKSVGNALRDISKKHKLLVEQEVATWELNDEKIIFTKKLIDK